MSEPSSNFLAICAAIILMLLVISAAFIMYRNNKENMNTATERTNQMTNEMEESEWTQYEGQQITGSEVISVIKHMKTMGTFVSVDNGNGEIFYIYTDASLGTEQTSAEFGEALHKAKTRGSAEYINPNTKFLGEIVRDDVTESILGLKFTKAATAATP